MKIPSGWWSNLKPVEGIEFEMGGHNFKCAILCRRGLAAIAVTPEGCCVHVLTLSSSDGVAASLEVQTVPAPGFAHAARKISLLCVNSDGTHPPGVSKAWKWKDALTVPVLTPSEVPGSSQIYKALAKTALGVVSRQSKSLNQAATRIRVAPLNPPEPKAAVPQLPFHMPKKYYPHVNMEKTLGWDGVYPTHLAMTATGGEQLRALVAHGLNTLLMLENGVTP